MHVHQNVKSMVLRHLSLLFHNIQKCLVVLPTHRLCSSPAVAQPDNVQTQVVQILDILLAKRGDTGHPLQGPMPWWFLHNDIGSVEEPRTAKFIDDLMCVLIHILDARHSGMSLVPTLGILSEHTRRLCAHHR